MGTGASGTGDRAGRCPWVPKIPLGKAWDGHIAVKQMWPQSRARSRAGAPGAARWLLRSSALPREEAQGQIQLLGGPRIGRAGAGCVSALLRPTVHTSAASMSSLHPVMQISAASISSASQHAHILHPPPLHPAVHVLCVHLLLCIPPRTRPLCLSPLLCPTMLTSSASISSSASHHAHILCVHPFCIPPRTGLKVCRFLPNRTDSSVWWGWHRAGPPVTISCPPAKHHMQGQ